ncbi:MAG: hypothetical protein WKF84_05185 [Pyrinomonadaceae bacterium]
MRSLHSSFQRACRWRCCRLLVVYFHRVSVASLLLNIWVGALMAALSIVSLAALALSQISGAWVRLWSGLPKISTG